MMSPEVARSTWAIMLSKVDLPAPDGPMMVRNSPSGTEKVRSRMIQGGGSRPWRAGKRLARLRTSSRGAAMARSVAADAAEIGGRTPAQQQPLAPVHQESHGEDDERRRGDRDEALRRVEIHRADLDEIAEAAVR